VSGSRPQGITPHFAASSGACPRCQHPWSTIVFDTHELTARRGMHVQ
jgi:hypothetical protein